MTFKNKYAYIHSISRALDTISYISLQNSYSACTVFYAPVAEF